MKIRIALTAAIGMVLAVIVILLTVLWPRQQKKAVQETENSVCEITILSSSEVPAHQETLEAVAEAYEKQREDVSVNIEFSSKESFREEICLRVEREENIDVVICDRMMMPALIDMGLLQEIPVTETLRNSMAYQKLWASTLNNGRYYGVPLTCDPYVLFYRRDLLPEDQVPQTWEELLDTGTDLRQMGCYSMGFPAKRAEEMTEYFLLMVYSMGGNLYSIDSETGRAAMNLLTEMWNRGLLPEDTINLSDKDLVGLFASGNLTMMANRLSMGTVIRDAQTNFEVGIAPLPQDMAGSCFLFGENVGLVKNAGPEAQNFLQYLCTPEISGQLAEGLGTFPVYTDAVYQPQDVSWCGTESQEPLFLAENRMMEPHSSWYQITGAVSDGVLNMLGEDSDTDRVASEMQDQIRVAVLEE